MQKDRPRMTALDFIGMIALYAVAVALTPLFMPHLVNAPTWSEDPMWYLSSAILGGFAALAVLYLLARRQRARSEAGPR